MNTTSSVVDEHDTLLGAEAIAAFINSIVDPSCAVTPKIVHKWVHREILPTGRLGRHITASKAIIRGALSGQPIPPAPVPLRPPLRRRA
jgi:hypothetical protein